MTGGGRAVEPFDPTKPNIARVWDYWLGGVENFAADRELAQKMLAVHPVSAQMARENRQFLVRAVSYVAARGIGQFIDVGAGLPTALNTHQIARRVNPEARVAYVDNDPWRRVGLGRGEGTGHVRRGRWLAAGGLFVQDLVDGRDDHVG